MDTQNPEDLLLASISELIATPRKPPQNKDDLGVFLIFCITAWEAVNNLLKSLKLSRTLLPEGLFPKGHIAYIIVAILNQIINEITSIRNNIQACLALFQEKFRIFILLEETKMDEILIVSFYSSCCIEESKIRSDLEVVIDLVHKNRMFQSQFYLTG